MSTSADTQATYIGRLHQRPLVGRTEECELFLRRLLEAERCSVPEPPEPDDPGMFWSESMFLLASLDILPRESERVPHCLLLAGEAGIGKTRLAEEYAQMALGRGWRVLWCQGSEQSSKIPYSMWLDVFRTALSLDIVYPREVETYLLPLLEPGLPSVSAGAPPFVLKGSEKLRVWEAASLLFARLSSRQPTLIVLDDLGWSDSLSRELLTCLAHNMTTVPCLIIGTLRFFDQQEHPDRWQDVLADLADQHLIEVIEIGSLDHSSLDLLLDHLGVPLSDQYYLSIREHSAGNPYFCEELARYFTQDGRDLVHHQSAVPPSLTRVLDEHLMVITPACLQVLKKAAVLGGPFLMDILAAMAAVSSLREREAVLDLLEEAVEAQVLTEIATTEESTVDVCYQFWHPLLATRLYEQLPDGERRQLHQRAADVLGAHAGKCEEAHAASILAHILRGDAQPSQIIHYGWLAGKHAYLLQAYPEAEKAFRLVLEHLPTRPVIPPDHQGQWMSTQWRDLPFASSSISWQAVLWELLGDCLMVQGRYEEACSFYERVLSHNQYQAKDVLFPDMYLAQYQALLLREMGFAHRYRGESGWAWECYKEGGETLREAGVTGGPAWAGLHYQAGSLHWQEGRYELALEEAGKSLTLFLQTPSSEGKVARVISLDQTVPTSVPLSRTRRTLAGDPVDIGRAQSLVGTLQALVGRSEEALDHLTAALQVFQEQDCQREVMMVCTNLGDLLLRRAEFEQARQFLYRAKYIAEQIGDTPSLAVSVGNLGILAARCGELQEAENLLKKSLQIAERVQDTVYVSIWSSFLIPLFQSQEKGKEAASCLRRAYVVGHCFPACMTIARVRFGWYRLMQVQLSHKEDFSWQKGYCLCPKCQRHIRNVEVSVRPVLLQDTEDVELRVEGYLVLAYAAMFQEKKEESLHFAQIASELSSTSGLSWLEGYCRRLAASRAILQGSTLQADQSFEDACRVFRQQGMHLEEARTLTLHAILLLQENNTHPSEGIAEIQPFQQRGWNYLKRAHRLACESHSVIDQQHIAWLLDQAGSVLSS